MLSDFRLLPSGTWVLVAVLMAMVPIALVSLTAFARIAAVLHLARSAIGLPSVPSNTVIFALSLALTGLAMAPVGTRIGHHVFPQLAQLGDQPVPAQQAIAILSSAAEPMRAFLEANTSARERVRFLELAQRARPAAEQDSVGARDFSVLAPAFMLSELTKALEMGVNIYLPFLVVDLVVANLLMGLGIQSLSPREITLPLKILLFLAVDGWGLLIESLVTGYRLG